MWSRVLLRLCGGAVLAVTAFALGSVVGARQGWFQPVVMLTVVNQTGSPLTELEVKYRSTAVSGTIALPRLQHRDRAVARFYLQGEGEYSVAAKLSSGKTITSQEGYVEPGYTAIEVLVLPEDAGTTSAGKRRE